MLQKFCQKYCMEDFKSVEKYFHFNENTTLNLFCLYLYLIIFIKL